MKITYFITNVDNSGGVERFLEIYSNYLVNRGDEVEIISIYSKNKPFYKFDSRVKFYSLELTKPKNKLLGIFSFIKILYLLYTYLKENKPDFIIGQWIDTTSIASIIGEKLKIKVIGYEHTNYKKVNFFYEYLRKKTYKNLEAFICLTKKDLEEYTRYLPINKIHRIPNPLSFKVKEKSNLSNKKLLAVGRLSYEKGFDRLVEIFEEIKDLGWILEIYGEDFGEKRKILDKIKKFNLENKIFLREKTNNIIQAYKEASVFLMSSRHEGFGNVLLEAMQCGLPIISYDCPSGPREIIKNKETGFLIEDGNKREYVTTLKKLIKDLELRKELGKFGKKESEEYGIEKLIEYWDNNIFKS